MKAERRRPLPPRAIRNQQGQAIGAKGRETRRRLVEATEELLRTRPLRELRVADVAKAAKTSTSTFYLYFEDVSEAVLAVIGRVTQSTPEMLNQVSKLWPEAEAYERAQHFVETYIELWQENGAIFRVRNLVADEGDQRFIDARLNSMAPLLDALAARIEERQKLGALPSDLHPGATAGFLLAMIERLPIIPQGNLGRLGVTRPRLVHTAAFFAAVVLGGSATVGEIPYGAES